MATRVPIGFNWQSKGACGKYSLQHALLLLGAPITQCDADRLTRVPRERAAKHGIDESAIKRAVRSAGFVPLEHNYSTPGRARRAVDGMLGRGIPVIVCVEACDHWGVLAGRQGAKYIWIDSLDDDLIGAWTWEDIDDWFDVDEDEPEYYLLGVKPKRTADLRHSLVPRFPEVRKLLDDADLCEYWGYYLEDLLEAFDSPAADGAVAATEFFDRHHKTLFAAVSHYYADADTAKLRWELGNYRKVAVAHGLAVSPSREVEAVARLSAALSVILCLDE